MPWQSHLWIGEIVNNLDEARKILEKLGFTDIPASNDDMEEGFIYYERRMVKHIVCAGNTYKVSIEFVEESEGGAPFWNSKDRDSGAMRGFELTSRYRPSILDRDHERGLPSIFEINLEEVNEILVQVHEWWSDAKLIIWEMFF